MDASGGDEAARGFWGVEPRGGVDDTPDINFRVCKPNPPQEQRELKAEAERALTIVKALYRKSDDRAKLDEAVAKLVALCQVGLVGPNASPSVGRDALRAFEADIVEREAGPIKNQYMKKLGGFSSIFGAAGFAIYLAYQHIPNLPVVEFYRYRPIFLVWAGAMMGAWVSFASRKVALTFSDLVALEEDRVEPQLRLIFTGALTVILSLIFATGVADVEVGAFKASAFMESGAIAFLLGAFAGLSEKVLPSAVMSRATSVVSAVSSSK